MNRHLCNDRVRVIDKDTHFIITRLSDGLYVRHKTNQTARDMMKCGTIAYFEKLIDDSITADIKRKDAIRKNREELKRIQEAQRRGIPTESCIIQPDKTQPPVRLLRIVPWYRRLWARVAKLWQPKVAVATLDGGRK